MQAQARRGAFHDYVRDVFAGCSGRARLLSERRASWLHQLSRRAKIRIGATNLYSRD